MMIFSADAFRARPTTSERENSVARQRRETSERDGIAFKTDLLRFSCVGERFESG
jgi:hypothetical protein